MLDHPAPRLRISGSLHSCRFPRVRPSGAQHKRVARQEDYTVFCRMSRGIFGVFNFLEMEFFNRLHGSATEGEGWSFFSPVLAPARTFLGFEVCIFLGLDGGRVVWLPEARRPPPTPTVQHRVGSGLTLGSNPFRSSVGSIKPYGGEPGNEAALDRARPDSRKPYQLATLEASDHWTVERCENHGRSPDKVSLARAPSVPVQAPDVFVPTLGTSTSPKVVSRQIK